MSLYGISRTFLYIHLFSCIYRGLQPTKNINVAGPPGTAELRAGGFQGEGNLRLVEEAKGSLREYGGV